MSTEEDKKTVETSNIIFSSFHYILTLMFFTIILVNIVYLTIGIVNMDVSSGDSNAETAKSLMIAAITISYIVNLLILIFLGVCYNYKSYDTKNSRNYYEQLMKKTGGENLYAAMRITVFSTLMFVSLIVSSLCYEATQYINKSEDPSKYQKQYNLCRDTSRLFMEHFILFTVIQGSIYIYQLLYNNGTIKKPPASIVMHTD